jgi:hypothetical protein
MARARLASAEQWRRVREQGMQRFVLRGALQRALPMTLITMALLELLEGRSFTRERLLSGDFFERVLFVLAVFLVGGALSTYARWKSLEALFGGEDST